MAVGWPVNHLLDTHALAYRMPSESAE
jgi:hypothetical protein